MNTFNKTVRAVCLALVILGSGALYAEARLFSDQQWREDLRELVSRIESEHFRPFHKIGRADFQRAVDVLRMEIPELSDREIQLRLVELVALLGDGHTRLSIPRLHPELAIELEAGHTGTNPPSDTTLLLTRLPVVFELFSDGLFIVRTTEELRSLLGARVLRIGKTDVGEAIELTGKLSFIENDSALRWYAPDRLALPDLLHYLSVIEASERTPLTLLLPGGDTQRVDLAPAPEGANWAEASEASSSVLFLSRRSEAFWSKPLAERRAFYLQINELEPFPERPTSERIKQVLESADQSKSERLILDLRHNFGGSGSFNSALIRAIANSRYNEYGRLYVLIGRRTFSAAQALVNQLEVETYAIFVGEPSGSSPGHFGDPRKAQLPNSGLTLRVSTLYWSPEFAGEFRDATAPHLDVDYSSADFFTGRDPVLETALGYRPSELIQAQVEDLLRRGKHQEGIVHFFRFLTDPTVPSHDLADEFSKTGHQLLDDGLLREGAFVFTLAREYLPITASARAGQGRAHELGGDLEQAERFYLRALELDPDHPVANEGLERIGSEP